MGLLWDLVSPAADEARRELLESMNQTQQALSRAYAGFNAATDGELVESYVYEINALEHRHSYLRQALRQMEREDPAPAR